MVTTTGPVAARIHLPAGPISSSGAAVGRGAPGKVGIHEDDDPPGPHSKPHHKKMEDDPPYADEYNNPKDHRSKAV